MMHPWNLKVTDLLINILQFSKLDRQKPSLVLFWMKSRIGKKAFEDKMDVQFVSVVSFSVSSDCVTTLIDSRCSHKCLTISSPMALSMSYTLISSILKKKRTLLFISTSWRNRGDTTVGGSWTNWYISVNKAPLEGSGTKNGVFNWQD